MLISDFLPINSRSISTSPTLFYFTPTKKVEASINLYINQTVLTEKDSIQYLGIMLDSNLNWKKQVQSISTKSYPIKTPLLCKFRHSHKSLLFTYAPLSNLWSCVGQHIPHQHRPSPNTAKTIPQNYDLFQIRRTFSPLFKQTNILKLFDLIKFQISIFMYKLYNNQLPFVFDSYFLSSKEVHHYNTRFSSRHTYAIPM